MVYIFLNIKHQLYKELRRFLSIKVSLSYRLANTIHDAELFYFHGASPKAVIENVAVSAPSSIFSEDTFLEKSVDRTIYDTCV